MREEDTGVAATSTSDFAGNVRARKADGFSAGKTDGVSARKADGFSAGKATRVGAG